MHSIVLRYSCFVRQFFFLYKMNKIRWLLLSALILGPIPGIKAQTDLDAGETEQECLNEIDLMILVDGSHSVTAANFEYVKTWIKDVARGFDIDNGNVQIGVVQYSYWYSRRPMWRQRYLKTEIQLGEYLNQTSFNAAVDKIKYQGYQTFTAHAINKTVDYDFQGRRSRYPDAQRAIILLTDGKATDTTDLEGAIRHAEEDAGVVIFAVGVGDYSIDELLIITSGNRNRVFELQNFEELANIVYELPLTLGKTCDCHLQGSIGKDCNECTRQCTCKPNVTGRRCDRCVPGYFNMTHPDGCQKCNCDPLGTVNGTECYQDTGNCKCRYYGVTGSMCDRCRDGMYGFPRCSWCKCNGYSKTCSSRFGICRNCTDNRGGIRCELCKSGFFLNDDNKCEACECNGHINVSDPLACDVRTGQCLKCLNGTAGDHCERCDEYHYRNTSTGNCEECECSSFGTDPNRCSEGSCECDSPTRQCFCLPNVVGTKCDVCADGFYGITEGIGCKPCNCHGQGSANQICDKEAGQCKCLPGYTGVKCQSCDRGHTMIRGEKSCSECDCNLNGSLNGTCADGVCSCDPVTGQCPCLSNIQGLSCDGCFPGFWGFGSATGCIDCQCSNVGSISESCDQISGNCECLLGYSGPKCKTCSKGYFGSNPEVGCKACQCNINGTSDCTNEVCPCDTITGECPCLPNVIGSSCDVCKDGYWQFGSSSGCTSCQCDDNGSVSAICDKNNGQCDCLPGYSGRDCDLCNDGYYGKKSMMGCRACDCNLHGVDWSECSEENCRCDSSSGQCPCLPNVRGKSCDHCVEEFWGFATPEGCRSCECSPVGSMRKTCDEVTGQCECLPGYSGQKCNRCSEKYFGDPDIGCQACSCAVSGGLEEKCGDSDCVCDFETGQCPCLPNFEGLSCSECSGGFWGFEKGCEPCRCNEWGSVTTDCNKMTGACECLPGYAGVYCDKCDEKHFGEASTGCQVCDCNRNGTESQSCVGEACSCDPVSGQCPCLLNVEGLSCDRCKDGHWNLGSQLGCQPCECSEIGSSSADCDKISGQCDCSPGYTGLKCNVCAENYYGDPDIGCKACSCNITGTESERCNSDICYCHPATGQCPCQSNVIGLSCDKCDIGYWGFTSGTGCQECSCNPFGSIKTICDENTGQCECLPGYTGLMCDQCEKHHYGHPELGCQECSCIPEGTDPDTCIEENCSCESPTGQCTCLANVQGLSCDECSDRFWNFGSEKGCTSCGCHGLGSRSPVCDKTSGQCDCLPGYYGMKCEKCAKGHYGKSEEGRCRACSCNLSGSVEASCVDGVCACDTISGQCPCLPNVIGVSCNKCVGGYWGFGSEKGCRPCQCTTYGSLSQSCDEVTGRCECLPQYSGAKCDRCEKGYYSKDPEIQCKKCRCDLKGTNSSMCVGEECECDNVTGQCPCLPNVVGVSCDKCDDGFWNLGAENGCESCICENIGCRSSVCNKKTGECDCYPGHVGPKCENCDKGYFRANESGRCQKCNCNIFGRNPTSCEDDVCSCDKVTGQCPCLPNVVGISCDRCQDGFWDLGSMHGCRSCGCHQNGSENEICEKKTGECDCLEGHHGRRCDKCKKGYFKKTREHRCIPDSLNDQPDNSTETSSKNETKPQSTRAPTTTTIRSSTVTFSPPTVRTTYAPKYTTRPTWRPTTRMPIYTARTFRPPPKRPECNRCVSWPSFCHGWICRRRWPHANFAPSPRRCNYGHTVCQYNVEANYGKSNRGRRKNTGAYYSLRKNTKPAEPVTVAPVRRTTARPKFGYRAYSSNYQYYIPYYSRRRTRTYHKKTTRNSKQPISFGLYNSLLGKKK